MSNERYTISKQYCDGVGDGLRYAYGGTDQYYPSQWENAIKGLKKTLQAKTATPGAAQQVIEPDSGYDGLSAVTISGDADLVTGNIKKDVNIFGVTGTFEGGGGGRVTQDSSGMLTLSEDGSIVAEVPLSVTQNGRSVPPTGFAYSEVNVAVSSGSATLVTKNITVNGTYNASSDSADGYSIVTVAVPTSGVNIPVSMAVTTQPTKTSYDISEILDLTGIVVTATYADGTTANVTSSCTFSPANGTALNTAGTQTITATYTYTNTSSGNNYSLTVTMTATTSVTVSVPVPTASVKAKIGTSDTITTLGGLFGPLGNGVNKYISPYSANNTFIALDTSLPYEIKIAFKLTQAITKGGNLISPIYYTGVPYLSAGPEGLYGLYCEIHSSAEGSPASYLLYDHTEFAPSVNTEAYIRVIFDGTDFKVCADDGRGSEVVKTLSNFTPYVGYEDTKFYLAGSYMDSGSFAYNADGAFINIENTYIKQNGTLIWGVPQS